MATDNALETGIDTTESDELDQAIDGLRGVLKKDAGASEASGDESVDTMGGAEALGSDFGADFADDSAGGGLNDPFNIGDSDDNPFGGDFGMGSDFSASPQASPKPDLSAMTSMQPGAPVGATGNVRVDMVLDIPIDVQIILGTSRMVVSSLMELSEGSTIALDRKIGEPVEIMVNGKLIGRGEITVLESDETRFGIRMIEVVGAPVQKAK